MLNEASLCNTHNPENRRLAQILQEFQFKKNWVVIEVSQIMEKCPYLETHVPWVMKFHKIFPRKEVAALLTACPHQEEKMIVLLLEIEI
jgi:integrase